ncbi:MAG: hypothetical protein IIB59_05650 [Planctomycetes bacterium]|nr:hypothetical protein [Planctomycetota bacterium]
MHDITEKEYIMAAIGFFAMFSSNVGLDLMSAISQVASHRGRLGNIQRNEIDPAINAQSITLENVTASESLIRDADMAVEISALTRAQILVQSTQRALQIANSIPNLVLSLLG